MSRPQSGHHVVEGPTSSVSEEEGQLRKMSLPISNLPCKQDRQMQPKEFPARRCMMSEVGPHLIIQPERQAVWFHPAWMQREDRIGLCPRSRCLGLDLSVSLRFPPQSQVQLFPVLTPAALVQLTGQLTSWPFLLWVWKDSQQGPCHGSMSGYLCLRVEKEHVLWEFPGWTASCLSWCSLVPADGKEPPASPSVMAVRFLLSCCRTDFPQE